MSGYDPTGNDIGRLVGQNAVYPSTMNCKAVLDCEERLDKYDSGTIDIPKNDPLNELLKDGGKQTVQEFIIDYGKGSLCAYMNQEKCEGFNPDMPTWPPEPEPKQCPSEKKK